MSDRLHPTALTALRQADALLAWVLLGWLGQRLGWSVASGVLPVVLWWAARCGGVAFTPSRSLPSWAPLMGAAALLASLIALPSGDTALLVLLSVAVLWGLWSARFLASGATAPSLPDMAMGLMMGSLWLSSQWCLGSGWTDTQAVALHLGLMVGVPTALAALPALPRFGGLTVRVHGWSGHALLAAGALLMAWPEAVAWRMAGMVLMVAAWSLTVQPTRPVPADAWRPPTILGPMLLLAVGLAAPTLGPVAAQSAWWFIAALAVVSLMPRRLLTRSSSLNQKRWSDAS